MAAVVARAVDAAVLEAREEERARIGELAGMSGGGAATWVSCGALRPGLSQIPQAAEVDADG